MNMFRSTALFLASLLTGSLLGQGTDNTLRTLTTEGVSFRLPAGWEWQGEIASNIAIKKDIKVKDQTYTITADLTFQAEAFLEDTIAGIEKKVAASKGDLRDLKTTRTAKFVTNPAVIVSLTRVRGEKQDQFEDERNVLFRRNNALYIWTERNDRVVSSQASGAFSAARSAVTFTQKDVSKIPKTWPDAGVKYNLPADFEYDKTSDLPTGADGKEIMAVETVVTVKGEPWRVSCSLGAQKWAGTLDDVEKQLKDLLTKNFKDVKDFQLLEKQDLHGEKAIAATFTGVYVPDHPAPEQPRTRHRMFYCKRKGYLLNWHEGTSEASNPALEAALKKGREGLTWL